MKKIFSLVCVVLISAMTFAQHAAVQGVPRSQKAAKATHSGAFQQVCKSPCASDITFSTAVEDVFTLNPRHIVGLMPEILPAEAEYARIDYTFEGAGETKEDAIASTYNVRINPDGKAFIQMPELVAHHVGSCKMIVTVVPKDETAYAPFSKEFTVNVVDYEPVTVDYSAGGTFILNEEWFGHTSGSINYLTEDGEYIYRAYGRNNDYKAFGATSQYGTIWNDKLLVMSKQNIDKGDPLGGGGRFVIADALTLEYLGSIDTLRVDGEIAAGADGRAVAGATPDKVYLGSTKGIYVVDITDPTKPAITGKIAGITEGANAYNGQVGDMLTTAKYVFAIQQKTGAHVIDVEADTLVKTFELTGIEGITQSMDGTVWFASTIDGQTHLIPVNPVTLAEGEHVVIPAAIGKIACEWSAWKTTQFFSNMANNELWFSPQSGWQSSGKFYRYVIGQDDINTLEPVFELGTRAGTSTGKTQMIYGASRYDHRSDRLIVMTTENGASGHYRHNWTYRIDSTGEIKDSIALEPYYWFQSMPIFPDENKPELADMDAIVLSDDSITIDLYDYVEDLDNIKSNIRLFAESEEGEYVDYKVNGSLLTIIPKKNGESNYLFAAESNGCTSVIEIAVKVSGYTVVNDVDVNAGKIFAYDNHLFIYGYNGTEFTLYNTAGNVIAKFTADSDEYVAACNLVPGVYILKAEGVSIKIVLK